VGDYAEADRLLQEMAAACQQKNYDEPLAFAWYYLGLVNLGQGKTIEAARYFDNGLGTFHDLGHRWGMALCSQGLALAALENGDYTAAARLAGDGLESARQVHDAHSTALCLNCLGRAAFGLGKLEEAAGWHIQAVETAWHAHQPPPLLDGLIGLGEVWAAGGQVEAACELLWLAQAHPAAIERERRRAERLLEDWAARLPGTAFAGACQRGELAQLDEVVRVILPGSSARV
jgi:tetratricopeptide (TPR) repeat protein